MSDLGAAVAALLAEHGPANVLLEATRQAVAGGQAPAVAVVGDPSTPQVRAATAQANRSGLPPGWSHPDYVAQRAEQLRDRGSGITPRQLETIVNLIERQRLDQAELLAPFRVTVPEELSKAQASDLLGRLLPDRTTRDGGDRP